MHDLKALVLGGEVQGKDDRIPREPAAVSGADEEHVQANPQDRLEKLIKLISFS